MLVRLLPLLLVPLIAAAQNVSFQGTAVNADDGQALAGVHIQLVAAGTRNSVGDTYGAISDKAGHFSMASVPPGAYFIICDRKGFAPVHPANRRSPLGSVSLKAGHSIADFKVEMTPRAVISGRVVDSYGDPIPHVPLQIRPVVESDGGFAATLSSFAQTNDRGEFRTSGRPGRYYISAMPNRNGSFGGRRGRLEIRTDGTTEPVYVRTFYPDTPSQDRATPVEVKPGEEVEGIEIRLSQTQSLSISGQISGIPAGPGRAMITLLATDLDEHFSNSTGTVADPNGQFNFSRLQPGAYSLFAQWSNEATRLHTHVQKLQLANADVTGVALSLSPAGEVNGKLEITGKPGGPPAGKLTVTLNPVDFPVYNLRADPATVDKDGAFHITGTAPIHYRIEVTGLPDNAYIKTMSVDGAVQSIDARNEIDLSSAPQLAALKIVTSLNGGQISGAIHDESGAVMTGAFVSVFLTSNPKDAKPNRVKANGTYELTGLRPGKYRLYALDMTKSLGIRTESVAESLAGKGEEVEVKEGDRINKNLTPLEVENAKPRQ